ncbi:MAG: DUF72 domain-containing protein [Vicinamibacterales bacterium]
MIRVGTSGYNYPEWKGSFYPAKIPSAKMLAYYAERLPTVEINYTFYRAPTVETLQGWDAVTPPAFTLTLKAPRRITHVQRLRDCAEPVARFFETAHVLGPKLGAVLLQLPPFQRKDAGLLREFVATLPDGACAAFEFRHPSWFDDEVLEILRGRNLALCIADSEKISAPVEVTADYAYFRLRDEGYTPDDLARWADVIRERTAGCREVFVYFKHEDAGKGPEFARILRERLGC